MGMLQPISSAGAKPENNAGNSATYPYNARLAARQGGIEFIVS
ncbi:hypothetical protein [Ferrigenium sp. UT5]